MRVSSAVFQTYHTVPRRVPYECTVCGKVYPKPSALERHIRSHTGERPFQCEACLKWFKRKENLRLHLRKACKSI